MDESDDGEVVKNARLISGEFSGSAEDEINGVANRAPGGREHEQYF